MYVCLFETYLFSETAKSTRMIFFVSLTLERMVFDIKFFESINRFPGKPDKSIQKYEILLTSVAECSYKI